MQFLFGFLIFTAAIYGLMIGQALFKLRKVRWHQHHPFYRPTQPEVVDPMVVNLLQDTANELLGLGFEPASWYQLQDPYSQDGRLTFCRTLYHPQSQSYAQLALHPMPESGQGVTVEFLNFHDDGRVCYTTNGTLHLVGEPIPDYDWEDPAVPTLAQQWQHHCRRLEDYLGGWRALSEGEFADWGNRFLDRYRAILCERGDLTAIGKDSYRLTLGGCWRTIRRMQKSARQVQALRKARIEAGAGDLSTDAEVLAHLRQDSMLGTSPRSGLGKTMLLLVSTGLFMASFGYRMDLDALLILLGVLLFHELGHLAAMALFGYRDLQILFIPFLGAVASGRKRRCPAWQSTIISLAGPVPGLVLAGLLMLMGLSSATSWMPLLISMLFFINFFNLLPIQPLDGGQLANTLLFQRWPRLQVVFYGLSVLMFLALAKVLETPWLAGIGFMLAFTLIYQYRESRVVAQVRRSSPGLHDAPRTDQLRTVYQAIQQLKLPWQFATRQQATRNVLERIGNPLPKPWESVAGLALYLIVLLGAPATMLAWSDYPVAALMADMSYEEPDWQEQLEAAENDQQRLDVLTEASLYFFDGEQVDEALDYNRQAIELLTATDQAESTAMANALLLRARIRVDYADLSEGKLAKLVGRDLDEVIRLYQRQEQEPMVIGQLADAYELKATMENMQGNREAALKLWDAALNYRIQFPEEQAWSLSYNLQSQAELYLALGDVENAEQHYLDSLNWGKRADSGGYTYASERALRALVSFYLDQQQYQQALDALEANPYPEDIDYRYYQAQLTEMAGWAHYKLTQLAEAEDRFESAIALIDQRNSRFPSTHQGYQKADNIARLMMVHQASETQPATSTPVNGETAADLTRLLTELETIDRSVTDYKRHLNCECNRHAGGYRLEQSERLRDLVDNYLPGTTQAL